MRKDGKSQYQLKKEKLKEIKWLIENNRRCWRQDLFNAKTNAELIKEIWEIVKDEK